MITNSGCKIEKLPSLKEVLVKHSIFTKKSLGQHFLLDAVLLDRIAKAAGDLTHVTVIEVGPGIGGLTRALLQNGAKQVIAIEKDERCIHALKEIEEAAEGRLQVIVGDALAQPISSLLEGNEKAKIVANLPYNVATVLLLQWLDEIKHIESFTLMFQKEVAERIVAEPDSKAYGRLSVISQWLCEVYSLFDITPGAFVPPPKVMSSLIALKPRKEPLAKANKAMLERLTQAVFGQRRKMLRGSLKQLVNDPETVLANVSIDPTLRPERLTVPQFCALACVVEEIISKK